MRDFKPLHQKQPSTLLYTSGSARSYWLTRTMARLARVSFRAPCPATARDQAESQKKRNEDSACKQAGGGFGSLVALGVAT